eukprot:CAMPEP_0204838596 /NCGR_PEP_ID=MMETSP1346-20131115/31327_1 /ASSEMBLY_ACC=CAM_ASM_000771 /TAXON_ID=215587 /ORGANISM="Aplanochytrium stocchinoi, Strain GSBS06" /LENGTH=603 /DNA_ID=CAMNT_0051974745 /DNA_START=310 /DNA_END=2121 /DNA_ORIENTATION=+
MATSFKDSVTGFAAVENCPTLTTTSNKVPATTVNQSWGSKENLNSQNDFCNTNNNGLTDSVSENNNIPLRPRFDSNTSTNTTNRRRGVYKLFRSKSDCTNNSFVVFKEKEIQNEDIGEIKSKCQNVGVFTSRSETGVNDKAKLTRRNTTSEILKSKKISICNSNSRISISNKYIDSGYGNLRGKKSGRRHSASLNDRLEEIFQKCQYQDPIKEQLVKSADEAAKRRLSLSTKNKVKEYFIRSKADQRTVTQRLISKLVSGLGFNSPKITLRSLSTPSLNSLGFNVFDTPEDELLIYVELMVKELSLGAVFNNEMKLLKSLTKAMMQIYNKNPFHNWRHAFSVAQMSAVFMVRNPDLRKSVSCKMKLAFFIAALGHDLDHPGSDNNYENLSGSQLAEKYNRQSVLENHHVNQFLNLILDEDKNIFKYLEVSQQLEVNQILVDLVLATDMRYHNDHVEFLQNLESPNNAFKDPGRLKLLIMSLIHACDLSGQCVHLQLALAWEERIAAEMQAQAKKYEDLGVEVPQHLRNLDNPRSRAGAQLDFINKVVIPLWVEVARVFPNMKPLYDNLINVVCPHYEILRDHGIEAANFFDAKHANTSIFETF